MSSHTHHDCRDHDHGHGGFRGFLKSFRGHSHEYSLETREDRQRLLVCLIANGTYGTLQLLVGYVLLGSMILVTDAYHNLSDGVSLSIPLIVIALRHRYRAASLALVWLNYVLLFAFLGWAALESWHRVTEENTGDMLIASLTIPVIGEVNTGLAMAVMASIGIAVNGYSVFVLRKAKEHDLNMRSAFEHQLVDLIASVAAVIGSVMIAITGERMIDPILTIAASIVLAWRIWPSFMESCRDFRDGMLGREKEVRAH